MYFGMKLYMFWTVPLPIIKSFSLYIQQRYMSYRFADSLRAGTERNCQFHPDPVRKLSGWEWNCQLHPDPARKLSSKLYDIYHCCVTVKNSWWWIEELSETCRISFQNKFEKLVHLVGFIIRIRGIHENKIIDRTRKKAAVASVNAVSCRMPANSNKKHDNFNRIARYKDTNFKPWPLTNCDNIWHCLRRAGMESPSACIVRMGYEAYIQITVIFSKFYYHFQTFLSKKKFKIFKDTSWGGNLFKVAIRK